MMDVVLEKMKALGLPMTRENYLYLAYLGNPPDELGPEEEAELPEQFQLPSFRQDFDEE
jgi:hypothetical protein